MITLDSFPNNKDKFVRLIDFFKEILDICEDLKVDPVLDGGLAVFAYTRNEDMGVNDVDLSCSEAEFPRIIKALEAKGIAYKLREWHVLEVLKNGLKIGFGSSEHWSKDLPTDYETLQIDDYRIKMLGLAGLRELYKRAIEDRAKKADERVKFLALKEKYEMLKKIK